MTHEIRYAARTDRGLIRANNQDSVFAGDRLLIIADGMGGHAAGDVASRLVVAAFVGLDELPAGSNMSRPLIAATREGNKAIAEMVDENPALDGMGTTMTALLFDGPTVALAHVGDSRAYLYRNGVLHQISHDDTFVQSLVDDGRITADDALHHPQRSLLLRALNGSDMDPTITFREISPGDRFLICSDGLSDVVSPESIADTLAGDEVDEVADTLIELALVGGGPDNVTVIVADVMDTGVPTVTGGVAAAALDPEATGPLQAIHLTQKMPRVPLPPIPEVTPAKPDYADEGDEGDDDYDQYDDEDDADEDLDSDDEAVGGDARIRSPRAPRRRWARRGALALALVVLVAVGVAGSFLWASTKYFVGADGDSVSVFRGLDESVLGWRLASVQENSCPSGAASCTPLRVSDLQQAYRDQVSAGIPVASLAEARQVIARLGTAELPICGSQTTTATSSTGPSSSTTTATTATTSPTTSRPSTTSHSDATAKTTAKTPARSTPKTPAKPGTRTTPSTPAAVTTTVLVTVPANQGDNSGGATVSGQRLRDADPAVVAPTTKARTTPAKPTVTPKTHPGAHTVTVPPTTPATPTVTVFRTTTVTPATSGQQSSGTTLSSAPEIPGVTCRTTG